MTRLKGSNYVALFTLFGGTLSNKGANDDAQQTGDCVKSTVARCIDDRRSYSRQIGAGC